MNIIDLLRQQHETVRETLDRIIAEEDKRESRSLVQQVAKDLRLHFQIEEKMVYPAASQAFEGDEDDEEVVLESYEEHEIAKRCLEAVESTAPNDRRFVVRAKVLKEILDKHIDEEETELFPQLEERLGPTGLNRLSDQVERRMSQLEQAIERGTPRRRSVSSAKTRPAAAGRGSRAGSQSRSGQRARPSSGGRTRAATKSQKRGGSRASKSRAS